MRGLAQSSRLANLKSQQRRGEWCCRVLGCGFTTKRLGSITFLVTGSGGNASFILPAQVRWISGFLVKGLGFILPTSSQDTIALGAEA